MNAMLGRLGPFALTALLVGGTAACEEDPPAQSAAEAQPPPSPPAPPGQAPPDAPPAAPQAAETAPAQPPAPPPAAQPAPPPEQEAPPAQSQWVYSYPTGQWVYTAGYGWVWVPAGTETAPVEGVPYAYLYTPLYGWTWYVSPWGYGQYHYGVWVRHPWHPVGWRYGWVAHPRVYGRLGGHYGGYHYYRRR